jgi:uncharacterized membrane protein YoaK (UPF0700 family)
MDALPSVAHLLSVPIFVVALAAARLLAAGLIQLGIPTLRPLLLLQFLLLSVFLAICIAAGPVADPNTTVMVFAAMLGVSAMVVQNALVQISLAGSPSTAVMTTNLTRLVVDLGQMLFGAQASDRAKGVSGMAHWDGDCRLRRRVRARRLVSSALRIVVAGGTDWPCAGDARNQECLTWIAVQLRGLFGASVPAAKIPSQTSNRAG